MRAQLTMAHIRISAALRSVQDAERSLALAGQIDGCGCTARRGCLTRRSAIMNDELSDPMQQLTGQVRSMFYLLDEPTTTLTIQTRWAD